MDSGFVAQCKLKYACVSLVKGNNVLCPSHTYIICTQTVYILSPLKQVILDQGFECSLWHHLKEHVHCKGMDLSPVLQILLLE